MERREALKLAAGGLALAASPVLARGGLPRRKPNFVVILCDDLGYGDVGLYGAHGVKTPNIDQMGREGVVLTDYYAPANICTPSRAGLLTGRYAIRTGLGYEVIMANDDRGLPLSEVTIAQALKPDYATGLFGKWHLGHVAPYWPPTNHGFDAFFGIPYSHDMKPLALYEAHAGSDQVIKSEVDYPTLQQQFYEHAKRFIEDNRDRPFFVELALSAPHLPEHPRPPFQGTSAAGAYGDVVQEIDSIVGRLLAKLKDLGLDRDTLVIFTSDNGPWFEGSTGGLRDRKGGGAFDGGYRVPFIARQPGLIPAGRKVDSIAQGVDFLPTFCRMAGRPTPAGVVLDGKDITDVLVKGAPSPHDELVLFDNENVLGIRTQRWKYVSGAYYRDMMLPFGLLGYTELYDMASDPSESYSVAQTYPAVAAEMRARFEQAQATFRPFKHKDIPPVFKQIHEQFAHIQD
ncbi:MAG TPA: sulfatase [Caulobacteraceae bacterium]|nr:sulfatase [Caulobacteraceae bacterium]